MKDIDNLTKASLKEELERVEKLYRRYEKERKRIKARLKLHGPNLQFSCDFGLNTDSYNFTTWTCPAQITNTNDFT